MRKFILTGLILSFGILQSQNEKIKKINDTITSLDEVIIKGNSILGNKFVQQSLNILVKKEPRL